MANTYHSHMAYALFEKETTWGTAVAAGKDIGLIQGLTLNGIMNWTRHYGLSAINTNPIVSGKFQGTGSIDFEVQHGRIFEYLTGGTVTHAQTTSDWKHTFALSDTRIPLTGEFGVDASSDIEFVVKGIVFTSATLSFNLDDVLRCRANFIYRDVDVSGTTASTAVVSTIPSFSDFQGDLSYGTISSESALAEVQTAEITINNIGARDPLLYGIGSKIGQSVEWNQRQIDFRATLGFTRNTEWVDFLGQNSGVLNSGTELTKKGLVLAIDNNVSLGSGRREVKLDLSNIVINNVGKEYRVGDYIMVPVDGFVQTVDDWFSVDNIADTSF